MSNRRVVSAGGVEDPLAPQPGPSQPTTARHKSAPNSKRKAPEESETGTSKRNKNSHPVATARKPKTGHNSRAVKGEMKVGGLIINPIVSSLNATSDPSSSSAVLIPPRPSSSSTQGTSKPKRKPPDSLNTTANGNLTSVKESLTIPKSKGKGKEREAITPTRQDLEVDEEVRRMEEERERLRVRDAESHSKSEDFKAPLIPAKASVPRRLQTSFASAESRSTPGSLAAIDSTQPIPVRDTPTIERNRAMRGEDVMRRSSMTMRGKRASSSFENTGVIPIPHPTVPTSNFHKHIDHELPEAHRIRHLLVWCSARMSAQHGRSSSSPGTRNPGMPLTAEGVASVQEVLKEMQKRLSEQQIDMSSRMDNDVNKPKVKEHEQNARNRKREDDFMRHIERSKQEDVAWSAAIKSYNSRQASVVESLARQRQSAEWMPPDTSDPLHDRELQGAQLARKYIEIASRRRGQNTLTMRMDEIENKVDRAHSALHISDQLNKWATRHLDVVFEGLAGALAARSQPPVRPGEVSTLANLASSNPHPSGMTGLGDPPDTLSILRALTRTDMERPRGEMGDAARLAMREVERNSLATGASERRLTAVAALTPRKAPGTPRRGGTPRPKEDGLDDRGDKST